MFSFYSTNLCWVHQQIFALIWPTFWPCYTEFRYDVDIILLIMAKNLFHHHFNFLNTRAFTGLCYVPAVNTFKNGDHLGRHLCLKFLKRQSLRNICYIYVTTFIFLVRVPLQKSLESCSTSILHEFLVQSFSFSCCRRFIA